MTKADRIFLVACGVVLLLVGLATFAPFLRGVLVAVVGYLIWRRFAARLGLVRGRA